MKRERQCRNGPPDDKHVSQLIMDAWGQMLRTEPGLRLTETMGSERSERLRSHIELLAQSEGLTAFFGVENEEFRGVLDKHLRSQRVGSVFFIDILGAHAWTNLLFHSYCYDQIGLYMRRNYNGIWNLSIVDERIRNKIEERLAKYVDVDDVMPDYGRGKHIDLQMIRILGWSDEDMKTDVAHELIDLHRVFNIPLFHVPALSLQVLSGKQRIEFHVAVDRNGRVPKHPNEGCWVYHETPKKDGGITRERVPYSQYKPKLPYHPLEHVWMLLEAGECKFAFEKRRELMGETEDRRRVLFVNTPTKDCGGFKGAPTSLLYAIGPLVDGIKARSPEGAIGVVGFSQLNILDPTYYPDNVSGELEKRLDLLNPHIVGFSSTSDGVHIANTMALQVKKRNAETVVILGGPHCDEVHFGAKENPNHCLGSSSPFDFAVAGDGEHVLPQLIRIITDAMEKAGADHSEIKRHVLGHKQSFEAVPGTFRVCFDLDGERQEIHCRGEPINLDQLPPLRYEYLAEDHFLDFDVFQRDGRTLRCVQVMTHRGCKAGCNFCTERVHCYPEHIKYSERSVAAVIDEIWHYVRTVNAEAVFFDDSTFIENEEFVKHLCRQLRKSGLSDRIQWGCLNRFDRVTDDRLIGDMCRAGLTYMYLGLELFDDRSLQRMIKFADKTISMVELMDKALDTLKKHDVKVGVSILFGLPAESEDVERRTIQEVGAMVREGRIDVISLSLLNYHLASAMTSSAYKQDHFNYLSPPDDIVDRLNKPPWNCFEEGGWFHAEEREIDPAYLARILFEVDRCIEDKRVLVRARELEAFIESSWDRSAVHAPEVHRLLSDLSEVSISKHSVVGKYVRHDESLRDSLIELSQRIQGGLTASRDSQCYLICGESGSGKTSFVEQLAMATNLKPTKIDLGETTEEAFGAQLAELKDADAPVLLLVDEIQTKADAKWPFENLKACMDAVREKPVTLVLAGNLKNLPCMTAHIKSRNMGDDVLRRIPPKNRFEIPPMTLDDKIIIALSNIRDNGKRLSKGINRAEKAALFFLVLDPRLTNAGMLSDFVANGVSSMRPEENRFMYDHMFEAGEKERRRFWEQHKQYEDDLIGKHVDILD